MVLSGSSGVSASAPQRTTHIMAAAASSSSSAAKRDGVTQTTLHNFSLPVLKTWGSQRILRCVKVNGKSADTQATGGGGGPGNLSVDKPPTAITTGDNGLDRVRAKLMVHLQEAAEKIDLAVPPREALKGSHAPAAGVPWNLRTRKGNYGRHVSAPLPGSSSPQLGTSLGSRSEELRRQEMGKGNRRRKFSVALSKEEIEEDLYSLTGKRASRRPKKRPRAIRNQLDQLFPGYYLSEVTPDIYDVRELPPRC